MNFEQLKALAKAKGVDDDLDPIYNDALKEMEAKGLKGDDITKFATAKVNNALKRQLASDAKPFEAVFYGIDKVNDWAKRECDNMKVTWDNANPETRKGLVNSGLCNDKGQALNQKFEKGTPIKPITKRVCFGCFNDGIHMKLTLYNDRVDNLPPLNIPVKFRANESNRESQDGFKHLMGVSITKFSPLGTELPMVDFVEKYLKDYKWKTAIVDASCKDRLMVLDDFSVVDVLPAKALDKSHMLKISAMDSEPDKISMITCWMPPTMELPPVDTMGAVLIGKVGVSNNKETGEEQISIQVMGFWIPPAFRMEHKPEPITEAAEPEVWTE